MKLTVMVDNNTYIDKYYYGEPALSYYIEESGKRVLFDTGYSDVLIKNAEKMGIDLNNLDYIVISHGHNDHTGGLKYIFENKLMDKTMLISHPCCFLPKYLDDECIGAPYSEEKIRSFINWCPSDEPLNITENIIFLGRIPRDNDFEAKRPIGEFKDYDGTLKPDFVIDDSALVYKAENGLFIITGCSHSGICNIIEYAKKICGCDKVIGVIGGFHLFNSENRIKYTADYFEASGIETLYPCHCVSLKAKAEMMRRLNVKEVGVGMEINIK